MIIQFKRMFSLVIPVKTGIQRFLNNIFTDWIPALAGMTKQPKPSLENSSLTAGLSWVFSFTFGWFFLPIRRFEHAFLPVAGPPCSKTIVACYFVVPYGESNGSMPFMRKLHGTQPILHQLAGEIPWCPQ